MAALPRRLETATPDPERPADGAPACGSGGGGVRKDASGMLKGAGARGRTYHAQLNRSRTNPVFLSSPSVWTQCAHSVCKPQRRTRL